MTAELRERFRRLEEKTKQPEGPPTDDELIEFGKKMRGRTFLEAWTQEKAWVKWMLEHTAKDPNPAQARWLEYVEQKLTEQEAKDANCDDEWARVEPESGAKTTPTTARKRTGRKAEADKDEAGLAQVEEMIASMNAKIDAMSGTMQQILAAIQSRGSGG